MSAIAVGQLRLYPIKSLPGIVVREAKIAATGALEGDRVYAIRDWLGRLVTGKRNKAVHRISAQFDPSLREVTLTADGVSSRFPLPDPRIDAWLSNVLDTRVRLVDGEGFPDHGDTPGPTVVSLGSMQLIATTFGLPLDEIRARFRANVELDTADAFVEDRMIGAHVTIGDVVLEGAEHCGRCVVPTRDPATGVEMKEFVKTLSKLRETSLPSWSDRAAFPHWYCTAILTRVARSEAGKTLRVGDVWR